MDSTYRFKAFISYAHVDVAIATALHGALESFAKRHNALRRHRIFRDKTTLAAGGSLPERLRIAIKAAEFLIVIASPDAAKSAWVTQEVATFLETHSPDQVLIVLARGSLIWSIASRDFVRDEGTAFPALQPFSEEPVYIDLTNSVPGDLIFQDAIATITATMTGQSKDDLVGIHIAEYDRTRRRLRFNLGFRGCAAAAVIAGAVLNAPMLPNVGVAALAAGPTAGAAVGIAIGLGWRGALAFALSFAVTTIGTLLSCIRPFRWNAGDLATIYFLHILLFFAAGLVGASLSKALVPRRVSALFGAVAIVFATAAIVSPSIRPFGMSVQIVTSPWLVARLYKAITAVFHPGWNFVSFAGAFVATFGVLGAILGVTRASVEMPRRSSDPIAVATGQWKWRVSHLAIVATVLAMAGIFAPRLSASLQKQSIVDDVNLRAQKAVLFYTDTDALKSGLLARRALRAQRFWNEASEFDISIREWIDDYLDRQATRSGDFWNLGMVAELFRPIGDASEFDQLLRRAASLSDDNAHAAINVIAASRSLGVSSYASRLIDRLFELSKGVTQPDRLARMAILLDVDSHRSNQVNQILRTALNIIATNKPERELTAPLFSSDTTEAIGRLLFKYRLWDGLPAWKFKVASARGVVMAMADAKEWDAAIRLASDRRNRWDRVSLGSVIVEIATRGEDFGVAFQTWQLAPNHLPEYGDQVIRTIGYAARELGWTAEQFMAAAKEALGKIDTWQEDRLRNEMALFGLPSKKDPGEELRVRLGGNPSNAAVEIEVAVGKLESGDTRAADAHLRKAWWDIHANDIEKCRLTGKISELLTRSGRFMSARTVADECEEPGGNPVYRLDALSRLLAAWN